MTTTTTIFLTDAHALQAVLAETGGNSSLDHARTVLRAAGNLSTAERTVREAAEEIAAERGLKARLVEQAREPKRGCVFVVGETYTERSIGDSDIVYSFKIVRRTAKSVWFTEGDRDEVKMRRISIGYMGHETFSPHGSYSMACVVSAGR